LYRFSGAENTKINSSPRDLNKIVRIEGYKFIRRNGKILYIKDTLYLKQRKESEIAEDVNDDLEYDTSKDLEQKIQQLISTNN
jgi:hypothetical protein